MNRGIRLREDSKLAIVLRQKLEQWLVNTNPALVKQITQELKTKEQHQATQ